MTKVKAIIVCLVAISVCLPGCGKLPAQFDTVYIDMPVRELASAYADIEKVRVVKDEKNRDITIFQRPQRDNVLQERYYVCEDKVIGVMILFSKEAQFDAIAAELLKANGKASKTVNLMGSQAALREGGGKMIHLIRGTAPIKVELPVENPIRLGRNETILIMSKEM